ncbi:hypothetical protein ABT084_16130 [Streptomyces sp. NPDC002138]|uniref:hypothetical protein n=1 Tax=Streptomyces sp. NPDC002138 TaxID=3154410 RepID=UPI003323B2F2
MTVGAAAGEGGEMSERLDIFGIRVIPADPHERDGEGMPEVRPLINGVDVIGQDHVAVCGDARRWLVPDGPFAVGRRPQVIEMATACGCHSLIDVTMRRDGDVVVWEWKENEDLHPSWEGEYRFAAAQYDAEVERATTDFGWEWPAQSVARVLGDLLRADADRLADRGFELGAVWSSPHVPDEVRLFLVEYEPDPAPDGPLRRTGEFGMIRQVTDEAPHAQAERLAREIMTGDPRLADGMRGDAPETKVLDWLGRGFDFGGAEGHK